MMKINPVKFRNKFLCPCCKLPTLDGREDYETCRICHWEDDGQDDGEEDEIWGGPNGRYSLRKARFNFNANFTKYSIVDLLHFNESQLVLPWLKEVVRLFQKAMETNLDIDWDAAQKLFNLRETHGTYYLSTVKIPNLIGLGFNIADYSESQESWIFSLSNAKLKFSCPFRFFQGDRLVLSSFDNQSRQFVRMTQIFAKELEEAKVLDAYFHKGNGDFNLIFTPFKTLQIWPICPEKTSWVIEFEDNTKIQFGPGENGFNLSRKNEPASQNDPAEYQA